MFIVRSKQEIYKNLHKKITFTFIHRLHHTILNLTVIRILLRFLLTARKQYVI